MECIEICGRFESIILCPNSTIKINQCQRYSLCTAALCVIVNFYLKSSLPTFLYDCKPFCMSGMQTTALTWAPWKLRVVDEFHLILWRLLAVYGKVKDRLRAERLGLRVLIVCELRYYYRSASGQFAHAYYMNGRRSAYKCADVCWYGRRERWTRCEMHRII